MDSASELDTKWLAELLKKDNHQAKPSEIVDVQVERAVPKGENYTSIIWRVKMKTILASGATKTFSLIVKSSINSPEHKKVIAPLSVFRNETKVFTTILQQMECLMEEFNDKRETLWPKLMGYRPYSEIVFEDLKEMNFVLVDRTKWQDLDHALLVLRSLGRYHAMTKILLERGMINEDDKGHYFGGINNPMKLKFYPATMHMLSQAMINQSGSWPAGWEDVAKLIQAQMPTICDKTEALYMEYDKKFEVLNHGDLWTSNMMFEHMEYTESPIRVKFVDYQVPHLNSFIWDTTNYLYISVKPSVRRAHKDQLLAAYHRSLSDNLHFFEYTGYVPTLEDVINEDRRLLPQAFIIVCFMPLATTTSKEAVALEKMLDYPPEEVYDAFAFSEEKLVNEIGDDLKNFVKLGVI